jgi:hypothetical protein
VNRARAAQDDADYRPGSYANYVAAARYGKRTSWLDAPAYAATERDFHARYIELLRAPEIDPAPLLPLAAELLIDAPGAHDKRPLPVAERELPDGVLADVVENALPDWRVMVERVTGDPFTVPTAAIASVLAFTAERHGPQRRVLDAWHREEHERDLARASQVVDRAPPWIYVDGVPWIPLAPTCTPPPGVVGGRACVARCYRAGEGWVVSGRVDLAEAVARDVLLRRLTVELWRERTRERRTTWEDLARRQPTTFYRACAGA